MTIYQQLMGCLAIVAIPLASQAAGLDTSAPLLCAATQAVACDSAGSCTDGPADNFNLPVFFKIDLGNKVVASALGGGERRSSKISDMTTDGGTIVLAGFEEKGGWNAVVDKATGKMTVSTAAQGVGYLIFGSCLNP